MVLTDRRVPAFTPHLDYFSDSGFDLDLVEQGAAHTSDKLLNALRENVRQ